MTIADESDIVGLVRVGAVVAQARDAMCASVVPGITTAELDAVGRRVLEQHGARSAPELAYGFPGATCISVNDELAHGVPSHDRVLREGDLVNIDVSAELDGYWADTGASYPVGRVDRKAAALLWATRSALQDAMAEWRLHSRPMTTSSWTGSTKPQKIGHVIGTLLSMAIAAWLFTHEHPFWAAAWSVLHVVLASGFLIFALRMKAVA